MSCDLWPYNYNSLYVKYSVTADCWNVKNVRKRFIHSEVFNVHKLFLLQIQRTNSTSGTFQQVIWYTIWHAINIQHTRKFVMQPNANTDILQSDVNKSNVKIKLKFMSSANTLNCVTFKLYCTHCSIVSYSTPFSVLQTRIVLTTMQLRFSFAYN